MLFPSPFGELHFVIETFLRCGCHPMWPFLSHDVRIPYFPDLASYDNPPRLYLIIPRIRLSKPRKYPTELIEFFPCNGTNSSKPPGLYPNSGILGPNIGTDLSNHIVLDPTGGADPSMRPRLGPISIIAQSRVV